LLDADRMAAEPVGTGETLSLAGALGSAGAAAVDPGSPFALHPGDGNDDQERSCIGHRAGGGSAFDNVG
jgi:hypothetical protein